MVKQRTYWPSVRYGPDGQARTFQSEDQVPDGWLDHPSKFSGMTDLEVEKQEGREQLADAKGAEAAARERIRLAQIEERRRTGSNTAADNMIRMDRSVVEQAEKQQEGAKTAAQTEERTGRDRNGDDSNDIGTVKEIRAGLESGKFTLDQVEEAEKKRETPRSTVLDLVERERAREKEKAAEDAEIVTRDEAIAELRKHNVEIADDATDAEIEAALNKLED